MLPFQENSSTLLFLNKIAIELPQWAQDMCSPVTLFWITFKIPGQWVSFIISFIIHFLFLNQGNISLWFQNQILLFLKGFCNDKLRVVPFPTCGPNYQRQLFHIFSCFFFVYLYVNNVYVHTTIS